MNAPTDGMLHMSIGMDRYVAIPIEPQGRYIPRVLAKFQSRVGQDVEAFIAVAGDWRNPVYYKYTMVPVKFVTAVRRVVE